MWDRRIALAAVVAALSIVVSACGDDSSSKSSSASSTGEGTGGVVTISTATVGEPNNPSVGVVQTFGAGKGEQTVDPPKGSGIYKTCDDAPPSQKSCLTVGDVSYTYGIGEFETTVSQYVTFLNTVDPHGKNPHEIYVDNMNPEVWPKYGSIRYTSGSGTRDGKHYSVAYPEWADKPFNFTDFRRSARFINSLTNGKILSKTASTKNGFKYTTYKVQLSSRTENGMYDMKKQGPGRSKSTGFVLPSNNEWVKAAFYDPKGGGTFSYWTYPTGPTKQPNISVLDPKTGDVTNADKQPLSTYNPNDPNSTVDTPGAPPGKAPDWCPAQAGSNCNELPINAPAGLDLDKNYQSNVSTVGQAKTPSPWGSYDMGGNVVEILDTLAPQPAGYNFARDWHYYHGGVANAPAYQLGISAFGYFPGDTEFSHLYPWLGFRIGTVGDLEVKK